MKVKKMSNGVKILTAEKELEAMLMVMAASATVFFVEADTEEERKQVIGKIKDQCAVIIEQWKTRIRN